MKTRTLRLGFSIFAVGGIALVWACSTVNNGTPVTNEDAGGTQGTGTTSTSSTATNSSTASTGSSSSVATTCTPVGLIDDMTGQQSETGGSWYTYSDRTIANSEPPIVIMSMGASAPGSIVPVEGATFFATQAGDASPLMIADGATFAYRECYGGGEKTWGAGFGLDLTDALPDGGSVAFNACGAGTSLSEAGIFDTSPDAGSVGIPVPFDASQYSGFAFWGISLNGKTQAVNVQVDDDQTSPWGGFCNVCLNGGTCPADVEAGSTENCPCSDNFIQQFEFKSGVWSQFVVKFANADAFKPADWSKEKDLSFHANAMYNVHFQFTTSSGSALAPFDVAVALLQWCQ